MSRRPVSLFTGTGGGRQECTWPAVASRGEVLDRAPYARSARTDAFLVHQRPGSRGCGGRDGIATRQRPPKKNYGHTCWIYWTVGYRPRTCARPVQSWSSSTRTCWSNRRRWPTCRAPKRISHYCPRIVNNIQNAEPLLFIVHCLIVHWNEVPYAFANGTKPERGRAALEGDGQSKGGDTADGDLLSGVASE